MKLTFLALSAVAIASYTNVQGLPAIFKRIIDPTKVTLVAGCFFELATLGKAFDDACNAAAAFDIGIIQSVNIKSLSIDFTGPDPLTPFLLSDDLSVVMFDINTPLTVKNAKESVTLVFNGNDVASFTSGYSDATVENGNVVSTKISKSPLTITAAHADDFGSFITSVLTQPSFIFTAKGALTANLKSPFKAIPGFGGVDGFGGVGGATPLLAVSGVGFESSVTMTGFNKLPGVSFVNIVDFTKDANGFTLTWNIKATNPSQLIVKPGQTTFSTLDVNNKNIGDSVIADLTLVPGDNQFKVVTTGNDATVLDDLVANGGTWTLVGTPTSNKSPYVLKGLAALKLIVTVSA
ncbi:MAG: hypothetical protein J3R72DRAFT_438867 [Linnemannia gamsii]|nr:MAG: hypothetical protein J3R72DRAFT_438867 [Linnemannia gamsii]